MGKNSKIERYLDTLMESNMLSGQHESLLLSSTDDLIGGTKTNEECSNNSCKNKAYLACGKDYTNNICKNLLGACGGSTNNQKCENLTAEELEDSKFNIAFGSPC